MRRAGSGGSGLVIRRIGSISRRDFRTIRGFEWGVGATGLGYLIGKESGWMERDLESATGSGFL